MNRILYFMLFVCFVQVQCENYKFEESVPFSLSNQKGLNNQLLVDKVKMINETRKSNGVTNNESLKKNNPEEENATFHPDTILFDTKLVDKQKNPVKVQKNNESVISFEEAMNMTKHEPIKPLKINFTIPDPGNVIPLREKLEEGVFNYESRKLFKRPPKFPFEAPTLMDKPESENKIVKKDLSKVIT